MYMYLFLCIDLRCWVSKGSSDPITLFHTLALHIEYMYICICTVSVHVTLHKWLNVVCCTGSISMQGSI